MRTTVQAPDGGYVTVEHPDDASEADVLSYAQANYKPTPLKIGAEGLPEAARQVGAEQNILGKLGTGFGEMAQRGAHGLVNLVGGGALWKPKGVLAEEATQRDVARETVAGAGPIAQAASMGGDILMGAAAAPAIEAQLARVALPRTMAAVAPGVPSAMGAGAALGATQTPDAPGLGAGIGGAAPAVVPAVGNVLRRTVSGLVKPTEEAAALQARGVQPTIGQAAGGWVKGLEERVAGYPIIGDVVKRAQRRAMSEYEEATIAQVLKPISQTPQVIAKQIAKSADPVGATGARIGQEYDTALAGRVIGPEAGDRVMQRAVSLVDDPDAFLSPEHQRRVLDYAEKKLIARFEKGPLTGPQWKELDSDLGKQAAKYRASASAEDRNLGDALSDLQGAWREAVGEVLPPQEAARLADANKAWRQFVAVRKASQQGGASAGPITAPRLTRATAKMRPDEEIRELARQGQAVLPATIPESGTAGRLALPGLVAGLVADPVTTLTALSAGTAGTAAGYTRPVQRALTGGYEAQRRGGKVLRRATEAAERATRRPAQYGAAAAQADDEEERRNGKR